MPASLMALALVAAGPPTLVRPAPAPAPVVGGELEPGFSGVVAIIHVQADGPASAAVYLCSGVLVGPGVVLTAAHCVEEVDDPEEVAVVFGETIYTDDPARVAPISAVHVHPDHCFGQDCPGDGFDFGLVVIDAELGGVEITPPLVEQAVWDEHMVEGEELTFVGFGATRPPDEGPALGEDEVGLKRSVALTIRELTSTGLEFIAGDEGRDSCQGDSGGPAYVRLADGSLRLVGISSRGVPPCGSGEGFYGTVYGALPWIRETVGLDLLPSGCDGSGGSGCLDPAPARGGGCRVGEGGGAGLVLLALFALRARRRIRE